MANWFPDLFFPFGYHPDGYYGAVEDLPAGTIFGSAHGTSSASAELRGVDTTLSLAPLGGGIVRRSRVEGPVERVRVSVRVAVLRGSAHGASSARGTVSGAGALSGSARGTSRARGEVSARVVPRRVESTVLAPLGRLAPIRPIRPERPLSPTGRPLRKMTLEQWERLKAAKR